jgi:ribose 5-phosphate isomerase B
MSSDTIWIGNDHGGYGLKGELLKWLAERNIPFHDVGSNSAEIVRYPYYAARVAEAVLRGEAGRGILICSTGIGMSIIANRYPGIRASLCTSTYMGRMTRAHNDSNILCLGGKITGASEALDILDVWLKTAYEGGRHAISLGLIAAAEAALEKGRVWEGKDQEPAMQFESGKKLIRHFKGDKYVCGFDVLRRAGQVAAGLGNRAVLVRDAFPGSDRFLKEIEASLDSAGVEVLEIVDGAAPNAPREDLSRIAAAIARWAPGVVISFGGGSTIDAVKAAGVLCTLGGSVDDYFGTGLVTQALTKAGKKLTPHLAIQTAASSGAHLTKYSNITDLRTLQKKLIVDEAIVPPRAIFDYQTTVGAPASLTIDGALDAMAHCVEVLYGAVGKPHYAVMEEVARETAGLVLQCLPRVLKNPQDREAREAIGLAADLGGYAIMLGGTNGAHLTSFSLIDILSHGRACAILNPYYTVLFASAIQEPLRLLAGVCRQVGLAGPDIESLSGRELAVAVAGALIDFERQVGVPTTLDEVPGFGPAHVERALTAAKSPQLKMKLENMPMPMNAEMVDDYLGPLLEAAATGDLERTRSL